MLNCKIVGVTVCLTAVMQEQQVLCINRTLNKESLTRIQDIVIINGAECHVCPVIWIPYHERWFGIHETCVKIARIRITYQVPWTVLLKLAQILLKCNLTVLAGKQILTCNRLLDGSNSELNHIIIVACSIVIALHDITTAGLENAVSSQVHPCLVKVLLSTLIAWILADNPLSRGINRNYVRYLDIKRETYKLPQVIVKHHVKSLVLCTHLTADNQWIGIVFCTVVVIGIFIVIVEPAIISIILGIRRYIHWEIIQSQLAAAAYRQVAALVFLMTETVINTLRIIEQTYIGSITLNIVIGTKNKFKLLVDYYVGG